MIELLVYALLSQHSSPFLAQSATRPKAPSFEIFVPKKIPEKIDTKETPSVVLDAKTALLALDVTSGKTLFSKKEYRAQNIASLTKLMTTLLILEEHEMDEVVQVDPEATKAVGASIDLFAYEKLTIQTLLEAILIGSANDAAVALAIHNAGSEAEFAQKMNQKARDLGLFSAQFFNATGLDMYNEDKEEFYGNTMSAVDLMRLSRVLLRSDFVRETVQKEKFLGFSIDEEFFHEKDSTNQLLGTDLSLKGLKTGYTELAGQCFIALGETEDGREILTVILGSEDRFGETEKLIRWIYDSFVWR